MKQEVFLSISGMSCVHCSRGIEKGLSKEPGIISARVFLGDESAEIAYDASAISPERILKIISDLGYEGRILGLPKDDEAGFTPLIFTAILALPVFYLAMVAEDSWPNRFTQMVFSGLILMSTGKRFFIGAVRSLKNHQTNMDVLVSLGIGTSWCYSTLVMAVPSLGHHGMIHFETAAILVLFILFGKTLERMARGHASESLRGLTSLQQGRIRRKKSDCEDFELVEPSAAGPGDLMKVAPGERFLVDGLVLQGESAADESLLTGEAMPVGKKKDSAIISGTVNLTGELLVTITKSGAESTLQTIVRAVRRAQADKPEIQRFADRASEYFVPAICLLAGCTFIGWLAGGQSLNFALMHAVTVLVVACPCALGLATPMAIVVSCGMAMKHGLLVKKPSALEALAGITFLLIDKTGTLTEGKPVVRRIVPGPGHDLETLKTVGGALTSRSIHPLSKAIAADAGDPVSEPMRFKSFEERRGFGIVAEDGDGREWVLGNLPLLEERGVEGAEVPPEFEQEALTPVFLACEGKPAAVWGLADVPRSEAGPVIAALKARGITTVMVSGDRKAPADAVAAAVGIGEVRAEVLPEGKLAVVKEFLEKGPTAFIGDGMNDAPALSAATVGLAIGSGADAAKEATDLVLMGKDLHLIPYAIDVARATLAKIRQNLWWAVGYNIIALPLASGILIPFLGASYTMNPMIAGLAMALSSVSVVLNSLWLKRTLARSI